MKTATIRAIGANRVANRGLTTPPPSIHWPENALKLPTRRKLHASFSAANSENCKAGRCLHHDNAMIRRRTAQDNALQKAMRHSAAAYRYCIVSVKRIQNLTCAMRIAAKCVCDS